MQALHHALLLDLLPQQSLHVFSLVLDFLLQRRHDPINVTLGLRIVLQALVLGLQLLDLFQLGLLIFLQLDQLHLRSLDVVGGLGDELELLHQLCLNSAQLLSQLLVLRLQEGSSFPHLRQIRLVRSLVLKLVDEGRLLMELHSQLVDLAL